MSEEARNDRSARQRSRAIEWLAGSVGFAVTFAILGFLGWQAVTLREPVAPVIALEVKKVSNAGPNHVVEFAARNRTPAAVAAVEVEGTLTTADGAETGRVTFDYIPGGSSVHGGLHFSSDPRAGELELRSVGHVRP